MVRSRPADRGQLLLGLGGVVSLNVTSPGRVVLMRRVLRTIGAIWIKPTQLSVALSVAKRRLSTFSRVIFGPLAGVIGWRSSFADQSDPLSHSAINALRPQPQRGSRRLRPERSQKKLLDVAGHGLAANDLGPQDQRRLGDEIGIEADHVKVVVEVLAATAMLRPAVSPRVALAIMADAPDVVPGLVGKEDVGAEICALALALEAAASARKRCKVHRLRDGDEHVGVLWHKFVGRERTEESNTCHAGTGAGGVDEPEHRAEQMAPRGINAGAGMIDALSTLREDGCSTIAAHDEPSAVAL